MKVMFNILLGALLLSTQIMASSETATKDIYNVAEAIPELELKTQWKKVPNVAQYGGADWNNVIGIVHQVTPEAAKWIADNNPEITYFFYLKGWQMVLGTPPNIRVFHHGDAVFFTGEPWWGSAPGLADGYIKQTNE